MLWIKNAEQFYHAEHVVGLCIADFYVKDGEGNIVMVVDTQILRILITLPVYVYDFVHDLLVVHHRVRLAAFKDRVVEICPYRVQQRHDQGNAGQNDSKCAEIVFQPFVLHRDTSLCKYNIATDVNYQL